MKSEEEETVVPRENHYVIRRERAQLIMKWIQLNRGYRPLCKEGIMKIKLNFGQEISWQKYGFEMKL